MRIFVHDGDSLYNFHIMVARISKFIKSTLNPANYHGQVLSPPFFEGWYFKAVDVTGQYRYAFIPGVFVGKTAQDSHAFVQVLEGASSKVDYHRYPIDQFWSAEDRFEIRIAETLNASIHTRLINLKTGEVEFDDTGKYAGLEAVGDLEKLIKMTLS